MKWRSRTCPWWLELLVAIFASAFAIAQQPADDAPVRFVAVGVYVDSKQQSLAAYQIDFSVTNTIAKIVGIEGGEHPAFSEPPFYDPKAMQRERVILAAFSTNAPALLPKEKTRIATIHLELHGQVAPEFQLKLETAAGADGKRIPAEATAQQMESR